MSGGLTGFQEQETKEREPAGNPKWGANYRGTMGGLVGGLEQGEGGGFIQRNMRLLFSFLR